MTTLPGRSDPSRRVRTSLVTLTAGMLALAAGCSTGAPSASGSYSRTSPGGASSTEPRESLLQMAERQRTRPDERAIAAEPPLGIPASLDRELSPEARTLAVATLDEVLASFPEPAPAEAPGADEGDDDHDINPAKLESLRSYVVGRSQRLAGDAKAAESTLREAARLDSRAAPVWRELAEANLALGNRSAAASALRRALELSPRDVRALDLQSRLELDRRDYNEAARLLSRLVQGDDAAMYDPALPRVAMARLGRALLGMGHLRAGAEAITGALDLDNTFSDPTTYQAELGLIYRERGDMWRDAGDAWLVVGDAAKADEAYASAARLPNLNPASLLARRVYSAMRSGEPARAALLMLDEVEGSGGQVDQSTVALIRHVSRHSDVGAPLAAALWRVGDAIVPPPTPAVRALLVRAQAAALPDDDAAELLRAHLALQPSDGEALRELMARRGVAPAARIDEVLALIQAAPIYEQRFAQALLLGGADPAAMAEAVRAHPRGASPEGRLLVARLLTMRGDLPAAESQLAQLVSEMPGYAPGVVARTITLIRLGRGDEARALLNTIDENQSDDLRVAKALAMSELGDPQGAWAMLLPLLGETSTSASRVDHLLLGARFASQLGELGDTERLLRRVLELDPTRDEAFSGLITLYNRGSPLASDDKLVDVVRRVRDADPSSPTLRWLRAQEAIQRRQFDLAQRDLMDLAEEYPDRAGVAEALVRVWVALDARQTAETWLREKMERYPDNSAFASELAGLLAEQKRTAEAAALLESRLAARPGDELIARRLEMVLRADPATRARADELAEARLGRAPQTPETRLERAELALLRGDLAATVDRLTQLANAGDRPLPPAARPRLGRMIVEISRRALNGDVDTMAVLQIARQTIDIWGPASPDAWLSYLRVMVKAREEVPVIIEACERAGREHEAVRVVAFAAVVEEMTRTGTAAMPAEVRDEDAIVVLEHASRTLKPAPTQLQVFWITRTVQTPDETRDTRLARAIDSVRQTQNVDEVLTELGKIFGRGEEPMPADEMAHALALVLDQDAQGELVEWLYRQSIRLNPDNIWSNNNLGYRLLVAERDLVEAHAMIERAYAAMKRDRDVSERASVTDSLGWARYKLGIINDELDANGNVVREGAVTVLTRGLELARAEPQNADALPIIAEHLADALWAAGQRDQATVLWEEALRRAGISSNRLQRAGERPLAEATFIELMDVQERTKEKLDAVRAGIEPDISPMFPGLINGEAPAPPQDAPVPADAPGMIR
jgi:tetratricopeptide (TPR) repeat protein